MKIQFDSSVFARYPVQSGVVFWSIFSVVAVAIRGVRWDENYEFAQVVLGQISYPEGHPLYQYVHGLFSLQHFSLAALMHFAPGPLLANALRNIVFLMASTLPVYLWGLQLSKRPLIGHCSVVLVLMGIHISFYSSYPIHVWPSIFSNGPIGLGYMLLAFWALAGHRHRLAGILIGFAPLIHLGQFPPLLACSVLYIAWNLSQRRYSAIKQFFIGLCPGIIAIIVFGIFVHYVSVPPPTEGPYVTTADPMAIWRNYMGQYASHRAIPYTTGHLALIGAMLLVTQISVLFYLRDRSSVEEEEKPLDTPATWVGIYLAVTSLTVWLIMIIHHNLGADIPFILAAWLPYRLMNHVGPLLIPLMLTVAFRRDQKTPLWLPFIFLIAMLAPLLHLVGAELVERYVASETYIFFMLFGAAYGTTIVAAGRRSKRWGIGLGLGLVIALAALFNVHQYGATCAAVGALLACIPSIPRLPHRWTDSAAAIMVALVLASILADEYDKRQHLGVPEFCVRVSEYLEKEGDKDAMILVPDRQVGMQMHMGHPVMADMVTMLFIGYRPELGPAANAIFRDFYGIQLDPEAPKPDRKLNWHEVWPHKSLGEWQRLSAAYDVHYVAAPGFMRLPLEIAFRRNRMTLYRIPPA